MNAEQMALIAADYAAGVRVQDIRTKYRASSEAVRKALQAHGIKSRGYGFTPQRPERLEAIAADLRAGMLVDDIRSKHKCGSEEVARAKRIYGIKRPARVERKSPEPKDDPRLQAIFADYQAAMTMEALKIKHRCGTDTIMRAVRALGRLHTITEQPPLDVEEAIRTMARDGRSMADIKQQLRVGFRRVHRVCAEAGIELVQWWGGRKAEPRKPSEPKRRTIIPRVVDNAPPAEPTREDYARLCDREFSCPPYLRQAPAMLARIEANERRERERAREIDRRTEARRARKAAAS